jgi:hypothetical protein
MSGRGREHTTESAENAERNLAFSWVTNQNDFHHNQATTVVLLWISLAEANSVSW